MLCSFRNVKHRETLPQPQPKYMGTIYSPVLLRALKRAFMGGGDLFIPSTLINHYPGIQQEEQDDLKGNKLFNLRNQKDSTHHKIF